MAGPANQILWRLNPLATIRRSISGAHGRRLVATAAGAKAEPETPVPVKTEAEQDGSDQNEKDDKIYLRRPSSDESSSVTRDQTSVTMPMSFMTGSIIGKRFYKEVTTRMADDGNGWTVILDYRTLKTPSKRPLKMPSLALAKAIAAEWEYQEADGIRPFTMPLMKLACTAMERVPLTRVKIIEHLVKKFHQDLVFCRSPGDSDLTRGVLADFGAEVEKGEERGEKAPVPTASEVGSSLCPDLEVDSWLNFQFHELDFGGGPPSTFLPPELPIEGLLVFVPSCVEKGGVDVYMALLHQHVEVFRQISHSLE